MHVGEGVFEVRNDLVFCLNRVRSALVHARVTGWFFLEYAGAQEIVVRCDVFKLIGKGAHTFELTSGWGKTILFGGHRFGDIYQLLLLEVEDEVDNLGVAAMYFGPRALREAI